MKAYKGLVSAGFNEVVYTDKEDYRALRWVRKRGINLQGFRLELHYKVIIDEEISAVEKKSGMIMAWLMGWGTHKEKRNLGIAKYYAACSSSMTIESNLKS